MSQQFNLLKKRRFAPFFWTQFLAAFNDNVYKNALIILLTFNAFQFTRLSTDTLINLAGAIFILPFLLFSATFGQIADKVEKSRLIRLTKILEISITIVIGVAFYFSSLTLLMTALFLFGLHSTLFGPVKYSILPQHLKSYELLGGNGLVEAGTFIAILTGTIAGGLLVSIQPYGEAIVTITVFLIAFIGWWLSQHIPRASSKADIKINWNIFSSTWSCLKFKGQTLNVKLAVYAISWFWFYGAFMFYQLPDYTKKYLGGNEHAVTFVIACFSVGVGIGSLLCERLSKRAIELGLVPFGALGISIFTARLYFLTPRPEMASHQTLISFLNTSPHVSVLIAMILIGVFSGFYTVPLYTYIQDRSPLALRARLIAGNNILNALFMILAAIFAIVMLAQGLTIPQLFLVLSLINLVVMIYIFVRVPEFVSRGVIWLFINTVYRLKIVGIENLPEKGSVIYACNHVSFVDVLVLSAVSRRPIRFLMDHRLFHAPILRYFSKLYKAIPVAPGKECAVTKEKAFKMVASALSEGDVIGIFPEGWITRDGKLAPFRPGIEAIVAANQVPVVPMALRGMWGSFFSRKYGGRAMSALPRRFRAAISLHIGQPIPAKEFSVRRLQEEIEKLWEEEI